MHFHSTGLAVFFMPCQKVRPESHLTIFPAFKKRIKDIQWILTDSKIARNNNRLRAIKSGIKPLLPGDIPHIMEIFYNASHLWTSSHHKLYYARNIIITGGINYLILNRFPGTEGRIDLLYVAWNKIQSATIFNATFFIILLAYVGTATDDEASCWAEWSSVLSFSLLITGSDKLLVTFVKGSLET